jgi:hypothetical protein
MVPADTYLDRDCFVAAFLAMTSTYAVIATRGPDPWGSNLDAGLPGSKRLVYTNQPGASLSR